MDMSKATKKRTMITKNHLPTKQYAMPFDNYYPEQERAIQQILETPPNTLVLLQAPTGSGKSAIVATVARNMSSLKTMVLTRTKSLQHQYEDQLGFFSAEGMSSYECPLHPGYSPEEIFCDREHCPQKDCHYRHQSRWAYAATEVVTNYSWFLSHSDYYPEVLVLDEAHYANDIVTEHMSTTFTQYDFNTLLTTKEEVEKDLRILTTKKMKRVSRLLVAARRKGHKKYASYLADLSSRIHRLGVVLNHCIYEVNSSTKRIQIIPKDNSGLIDTLLLKRAVSLPIMMSATILDPVIFMREKGLDHIPYTYIELPNVIAAERRPIFYYPTTKVGHKDTNYKKLVNRIDDILDFHKDQKGIIHTSNFVLAERITYLSRNKGRLMVQDKETDRIALIDSFMNDTENSVLVSPSITTGVDLPDEMARFAIFAKIPFPNMTNKRVREKMKTSNWYEWTTICEIVQGSGRTIRHKDDFGITYILDSNFGWFYSQNKRTFPKWWRDALQ